MEPDQIENFYPYGDRILIEVVEPETESAGGVILPELTQERPTRGTVIRAGREPCADTPAPAQTHAAASTPAATAPSRPEPSCDHCESTDDVMYGQCSACFAEWQAAA